jgi:PsbP
VNLLASITTVLVVSEAGAYTPFESETGFKIRWPRRYKTDQSTSTSTKLYIYLADNTPVDAITVSTDESFNEHATLDKVTERYADAITSAYKELKVLSKERTTLSGNAAFRTIYRGTLPVKYDENTVREETLKVNQTWTLRNARVYTLTYKALARDYNRYLPQARSIMKSFALV